MKILDVLDSVKHHGALVINRTYFLLTQSVSKHSVYKFFYARSLSKVSKKFIKILAPISDAS